uniref:Secreted frizzled-related protein 1 n=1 Tax=Ciona intestinalis TaxID=7719 RepID=Q4H2U4_CIOIN|nr:secreted frizzled-related protein precursor [Ciona intestinalis]XP_026695489.1 secreted frizzled-related protein isoform X1 [Ciona intestinalis]BAE06683.1 secreted frizzled-related protein [Ciona intestinalis]|eukprot:NP_001072004.1 secreted frizzled-related protein precursor [Ciona intestinalis]
MKNLQLVILYTIFAFVISTGSGKRKQQKRPKIRRPLIFPQPAQPPDSKCEIIPEHFGLCYGMEYPRMRLPNLLGHATMTEVLQQSRFWPPLVSKGCNPETRKFLCSLFAPVCMKGIDRSIPPCRGLCEAVRDNCSRTMRNFGYPWPEILNCTQFPQQGQMCIEEDRSGLPTPPPKVCQPCRRRRALQYLKTKFCSFDFVMKVRVKNLSYGYDETRMVIKPKHTIRWDKSLRGTRKNDLWMRDGFHCRCSVINNIKKSYLVTGWKTANKLVVHSILKWNKKSKRVVKRLKRAKC